MYCFSEGTAEKTYNLIEITRVDYENLTTNANGYIVLPLSTSNTLILDVRIGNANYFPTFRGLYNGNWYLILETYAGERAGQHTVDATVYYIKRPS